MMQKSAKQRKYDQKDGLCSIDYTPSEIEIKASHYCIAKDIRISPVPASEGPMPIKWHIGISEPANYKKIYRSKFQYDNHQVWEAYYEMCLYYYNKDENNEI